MKKISTAWVCLLFLIASATAAPRGAGGQLSDERFVGTWTGTWEGNGSGGLELTLDKGPDGALTGRVVVTGEPAYKATIKTLSFDGPKMTARYDYPLDEAIEVTLAATFDGSTTAGTWSAREKASGNELATGTWKATKK